MATENPITEEQAGAALRDLMGMDHSDEGEAQVQMVAEPAAQVTPAEAPVTTDPAPAEAAGETTPEQVVEAPSDDVDSLRKRLAEVESTRDAAIKAASDRTEAVTTRSRQNEQILRERLLKKSSATDRALKTLKEARSDKGVPEAEVDRVIAEIQAGMNPQSASYAPLPEVAQASTEDQVIVLNDFLNEKGLTNDEAEKFGSWIRSEAVNVLSAVEQDVARRDLDGFLHIAHVRFKESAKVKEQQRVETIGAVRVVQRAQREAAKAASSAPSAPHKQSTGQGSAAIDVKKLTGDDISQLLKLSVQQYK